MIALFRLLPLWGQATAILAVLSALGGSAWGVHHKIYQSGYDAAIADVAAENKEAIDAADKARARVRDCNARDGMRWNQITGQCEPRD